MSSRLQNNKVAARYAKALFESISQHEELNAVAADLAIVNSILSTTPIVESYFANPGISLLEKTALVEQQLAHSVHPRVAQILKLLVENGRMAAFSQLCQHFTHLLQERENIAEAEVITAVKLEDELRNRIRKTLETTFGFNHVELSHRVDPSLLGGAVIKIRDQIIDGSYIGRLEELRKQISNI